jgi:AcrR family transcriptional regulator
VTQAGATGRRPRDRRQQILAAAAEQFRVSGYHNVGVTDIADAVGITGAAVYRHFRGKQELLLATVQDAFDYFAGIWGGDYASLDQLLVDMAAATLQRPDIGVLWEREVAHLPADVQADLRAQFLQTSAPVRVAIAEARSDLPNDIVDVLLWAVLSALASVGYHSVKLDSARYQARFVEATQAMCMRMAPAATADGMTSSPPPAVRLLPTGRREAILVAAMRLFTDHGYQSVGVDDVGAAAGITGATVYHHFPSKSALLAAAVTRCLEAMMFDLTAALDRSATPSVATDLVLRHFVRTSTIHDGTIGTLIAEINSLPAAERGHVRQMYQDYLGEWVALLMGHRPDLAEGEAQVLVYATITMVNSLLRIPHVRRRPTLPHELVVLGQAVLGIEMKQA